MSFCWFTSFIGYPNFFSKTGRGAQLANAYLTLANAAEAGMSYSDSKRRFPAIGTHQVETKKAAFQEFGLLYVVPRSNALSLTPLGRQVFDLCMDKQKLRSNRRILLLALAGGLARYQFNNPLPVGGPSTYKRMRAHSSDVLPYLACFYLLHKLGGVITASELRGAVFGLSQMAQLRSLEAAISKQRGTGLMFGDIASLPSVRGTADNLKIYFIAHLGLDNEIMNPAPNTRLYKGKDQVFELTQLGFELTESILDAQWPNWRAKSSPIPSSKAFSDIDSYFVNGVGQACPLRLVQADARNIAAPGKAIQSILDDSDAQMLKDLLRRDYRENLFRLVQHTRLERRRNPTLVRDAKYLFKKTHGKLFCEVCGFDFEAEYGNRGKNYIEAHHKMPLAQLTTRVVLKIADLAMVCSNCHRMLHKPPFITVENLRASLKASP